MLVLLLFFLCAGLIISIWTASNCSRSNVALCSTVHTICWALRCAVRIDICLGADICTLACRRRLTSWQHRCGMMPSSLPNHKEQKSTTLWEIYANELHMATAVNTGTCNCFLLTELQVRWVRTNTYGTMKRLKPMAIPCSPTMHNTRTAIVPH